MPDMIITTGKITYKCLGDQCGYDHGRLKIGCGIKQEKTDINIENTIKRQLYVRKILVGLEGVWESAELINFVIDAFYDKVNHEILLRGHPVLPISVLHKKINYTINDLPSHFRISQNTTLLEDIQWSDILLYCGSSVSLEALKLGVPIIHISLGQMLNVDPCYSCKSFNETVRTKAELFKALDNYMKLSEKEIHDKTLAAREYSKQYYQPVTDDNLNAFLCEGHVLES